VAVTLGLAPGASATDGPLDEARGAMEKASFVGSVRITWSDGAGRHETVVTVRAERGALEVDGPVPIITVQSGRFVRTSAGWRALWPEAALGGEPPNGSQKYQVVRGVGPMVAGRPTVALEVSNGSTVRERLALDRATGVLLRREQLGADGQAVRGLEFVAFEPVTPAMHRGPVRFTPELPATMTAAALRPPYRAPASLPGGYHRLGTYRRGDVMQVVYGDGLYGLSVFEQPGRIHWDQLPSDGRPVTVGGHPGRSFVWPGGDVLTWQAGSAAYTVVGDGPAADLIAAAQAIRAKQLSAGQRVRQAARELVQTLGGA
jgi:negative regulator of sigma E activity